MLEAILPEEGHPEEVILDEIFALQIVYRPCSDTV
jgi:hypothetical protein